MALPPAATVSAVTDVAGLIALMGMQDEVWRGFVGQVGDPGTNIGHLAALPAQLISAACSHATMPDGGAFVPIHASQVGLVWRVARKHVFLANGGLEADFQDIEPWDFIRNPGQAAAPASPPKASSVKENVLKMASLVDQTDESELLPASMDKVQEWTQRYITLMGAPPEEEEEATDAQLAALHKRTVLLGHPPYVDFSVWTPFGRRSLRSQKFRTYVPLGDGSYIIKELPGPQNLTQWMACWRVFKVAALALGIVSLAALQQYEKAIEKLTLQWPLAWGLIVLADDKGRAERLEKIRRNVMIDQQAGRVLPLDWDEQNPWSACFKMLAKDEQYWSEQVRHPAAAWTAAGSHGVPVAPAEAIAATHVVGGSDVLQAPKEERDERRRQANRDKRSARKKRQWEDREELRKLKSQRSDSDKGKGKGQNQGKGKSKDKTGAEICFSWAQAKGTCADVPVGGECRGKVRRAHKCQLCLSPGHNNSNRPQK